MASGVTSVVGFRPSRSKFYGFFFLILCLGQRCLGKWALVVPEIFQYYNFFNETPAVFREGKMTRATMENIQLPIGDWVGRPTKGFIRIFKQGLVTQSPGLRGTLSKTDPRSLCCQGRGHFKNTIVVLLLLRTIKDRVKIETNIVFKVTKSARRKVVMTY